MVDQVTWYFAFIEGGRRTFWSRWCKTGFSHCAVFAESGPVVVSVEPVTGGISVRSHWNTEAVHRGISGDDVSELFKQAGWRIVKHTFGQKPAGKLISLSNCWPSCVTVAKIATGYSPWCFTPWQLYKKLMKDGAVEI